MSYNQLIILLACLATIPSSYIIYRFGKVLWTFPSCKLVVCCMGLLVITASVLDIKIICDLGFTPETWIFILGVVVLSTFLGLIVCIVTSDSNNEIEGIVQEMEKPKSSKDYWKR